MAATARAIVIAGDSADRGLLGGARAGRSGAMGHRIRLAREEEVAALNGIEARAATIFRDIGRPEVAELGLTPISMLEAGRLHGLLWVAEADALAGYLLAGIVDGELHIEQVDVDPAHQRRGVGRALVERACEEATARGLPSVTLVTFRDVPWNAPFYASAGFVVIERHEMGPELGQKADFDATRLDPSERVTMRRALPRS